MKQQRENKFRAYCQKRKQMFYSDDNQTVWAGGAEISVNTNNGKIQGDFIGMQYTGLKDKNLVDIYEGDILKLIDSAGMESLSTVVFGNHRRQMATGFEVDIAGFAFVKQDGMASFPIVKNYKGVHDLNIIEVIGNIHEHPSLLNS